MKKGLLLLYCLISNCYAQDFIPKSSTVQTSLLQAITVQNEVLSTNYYYGATLLDTPYALQIPFREMNDAEVLKGYKEYKNFNRYANNVFSVAILVFIANSKYFAYGGPKNLILLNGGALAVKITLQAIGRKRLKNSINRFNSLLNQ